jgi:hypothetical protein
MAASSLSDEDYNAFARGLTNSFGGRVVGRDPASERLLGVRPADHILAGFLTPTGKEELDDPSADDLPRDSAYEQSSIGFEWLVPIEAVTNSDGIDVQLEFYVYVRRLPTFEELLPNLVWRTPRSDEEMLEELASVPLVWTREGPFRASHRVSVSELLRTHQHVATLAPQVVAAVGMIDTGTLFPGRRSLKLSRTDVGSTASYESWKAARAQGETRFPGWTPQLDARATPVPLDPRVVRLALRIVNRTPRPTKTTQLDFIDPNLYCVHVKASLPQHCHRSSMFNELPASYRYDRSLAAVGINSQPIHSNAEGRVTLQTRSIATLETARLLPRDIAGASPTFDGLTKDPGPLLSAILADMQRYAREDWANRIDKLGGDEQQEAAVSRDTFLEEILRFQEGARLLADAKYPSVLRAFILMNEAIAAAAPQYKEWRLFQIVFIVSHLRELAAREHSELQSPGDGAVDILWFAAGGGKTEAFLGLILWQAFFDRLRGKAFGTTAVVRFPLRLLGFQQFQRIGRALAQAELIRMREKLGGARFSLGFFVGSQVTPNKVDDGLHAHMKGGDIDGRLQRVLSCPFCSAPVTMAYEATLRLLEHRCTSPSCPGGDKRLPVYIIDADVYRFLPTVLVATVDKFALLGQNQRLANLLGRIDLICHKHGASFSKTNRECEAAVALANGERVESCRGDRIEYGPFHDLAPALLVQDEMHLLSEELGAFDAHYETAMCHVIESLGGRPWKIIGATATIEDYENHARQLYLRAARRFPAPGPEAESSFYYQPATGRLGRIFVGLQGVGRKHTPIVARALSLLYLELEQARALAVGDPTRFTAKYGVRPLPSDSLIELVFRYEIPLTYVLTRKGSDQVSEAIESRVKTELQAHSPHYLDVRTFNSGVDMVDMIGTMDRIQKDNHRSEPGDRIRGVVATSIIGHGVDVDRFNVMVFAGFTRLVAEYIQASARVGRTFPGISILVITPQSERDRSVFERFDGFHRYVDRLVDPSALTRWSEPALSRTVGGILCGYLFAVAARQLGRPLATVEDVQAAAVRGPDCLLEDAVVRWVQAAYGTQHAPSPGYADLVAHHAKKKYAYVLNAAPAPGVYGRNLGKHLGAMKSLRDVDEPAVIRVGAPDEVLALRRLING